LLYYIAWGGIIVKSSINVNFKLQELRKKFNLSHEKIAQEIGISKAYYWQIEHNNRRLYYELAVKIAKVFNLKPDDIFYDFYK